MGGGGDTKGWYQREIGTEAIYIHSGDTAVWVDGSGRVRHIINSTHPDPLGLTDQYIQSLLIDGFVQRFQEACTKVRADGRPREFNGLVNFRGRYELRRCRILKAGTGLLVLNYKIECFS